jgi:ribosomal protein S10
MILYSVKIKFSAINYKLLKIYSKFLINLLNKLNIEYNFFNLPIKKKLLTFLKSPHIYKKAVEHFEIKKFSLLFVLKNLKNFSIFSSLFLNKPHGIKFKVLL